LAAGHLAGGLYGHPIRLIDVASEQPTERQKLENRLGNAVVMAFSPDGRTLAVARYYSMRVPGLVTGPGHTMRAYEVATGRERWSFTRWTTSVQSLSFAAEGSTLAIGWADGQVTLVETASGKQRAEFQAGTAKLDAIAYSLNSKLLATAGEDGQVAVWAGSEKRWAVQLPGSVAAVAWAPDSRHLATANANGTVYILRVP
jgi:eukaryotic-like serine/threonine-protein kinase